MRLIEQISLRVPIYLYILLLFSVACKAQPKNEVILAQNGQSTYEIYISNGSDTALMASVKDFQKYFYEVSGVNLSITNERRGKNQIVIGDREYQESIDESIPFNEIQAGGFNIKVAGSCLLISSNDDKGAINGIYTFLEDYLGCRYYASDAIFVPKKDSISFSNVNRLDNPGFQLRYLHSFEAFSAEYANWRKIDLPPKVNPLWAKPWIHTTTQYVSPKTYFSSHPEYFMLWKEKRISKDVNFSNNSVLNIVKEGLEEELRKNSNVEYLGASQADGNRNQVCECDECGATRTRGGSPSAVTIDFANKLARQFPAKTVTTLAYFYTLEPPKNVKLEKNLLVIVCNSEYDKVVASELRADNDFIQNLKHWQMLTKNIMVWDYVANKAYPQSPFPNLFLLQKGVKGYKNLGVDKIFVESYNQKGDEFQELRSYLLSKLLWNPDVDVDSVINDFLNGYYGEAAPFIRKYIDKMTSEFNASTKQLKRNIGPDQHLSTFLSIPAVNAYESFFNEAKLAVKNDEVLLERIDKAQQALRFVKLEFYGRKPSFQNGSLTTRQRTGSEITADEYNKLLTEFTEKVKKYGGSKVKPKVNTPKQYLEAMQERRQ